MSRPGQPVRGSRSGRPEMVALDLLSRRHMLRVLWELTKGPATFRGLQDRCGGLSPTVLNKRLGELRDAALAARDDDGYVLTDLGEELMEHLEPLRRWSRRWARRLESA